MNTINQNPNQVYNSAVNLADRLGSGVNIPEMGMLMQIERHGLLEKQVKDQFSEMQKRNEWLRDASNMLDRMRAERPDGDKTKDLNGIFRDVGSPPVNMSIAQWAKAQGIDLPAGALKGEGFDRAIQTLKSSIDTANTNSQMDMVRMQGLMDKMNQAVDFMTNWSSKNSKTMDSIIQNIR